MTNKPTKKDIDKVVQLLKSIDFSKIELTDKGKQMILEARAENEKFARFLGWKK